MDREPDVEIAARARADEVRFACKPEVRVRAYADAPATAESVSERENLPDEVRARSHLPQCLGALAAGRAPGRPGLSEEGPGQRQPRCWARSRSVAARSRVRPSGSSSGSPAMTTP